MKSSRQKHFGQFWTRTKNEIKLRKKKVMKKENSIDVSDSSENEIQI